MIRLPRRPPKNSPFGQWANELLDALEKIIPRNGPNAKTSNTVRGSFKVPDPATGGGTAPTAQVPTQWVDGPYNKGDLVIREKKEELDDGKQGGTYYATKAVKKGDPAPGADKSPWADFALGRWEQITFRVGNQRIRINAGRDNTVASFEITSDYTDADNSKPTTRGVFIDLVDLGAAPQGIAIVRLRETWACDSDTGTTRRAMVLRSEYYD